MTKEEMLLDMYGYMLQPVHCEDTDDGVVAMTDRAIMLEDCKILGEGMQSFDDYDWCAESTFDESDVVGVHEEVTVGGVLFDMLTDTDTVISLNGDICSVDYSAIYDFFGVGIPKYFGTSLISYGSFMDTNDAEEVEVRHKISFRMSDEFCNLIGVLAMCRAGTMMGTEAYVLLKEQVMNFLEHWNG